MTPVGKLIITAYSIIVILVVMIRDFKSDNKGFLSAILLPTLILLINLV